MRGTYLPSQEVVAVLPEISPPTCRDSMSYAVREGSHENEQVTSLLN
jgi:hypothetical protein